MKKVFTLIAMFLLIFTVFTYMVSATPITVYSPNVDINEVTQFYYVTFLVDGVSKKILLVPENGTIPDNYLPDNPDKEGYVFEGWTFRENDPAAVTDFSTFEVIEDMFFYAYWSKVQGDGTITNNIYYSDIFFEYPKVLYTNPYLSDHNLRTLTASNNVILEYTETPAYEWSIVEHSIEVATSPTETAKWISDSMGLSSFKYNDELDNANQLFVQAISNVNLDAANDPTKPNKYVKNMNKALKVIKDLDKQYLENQEYYGKIESAEVYDYFIDQAFAMLTEECTSLTPKLPSAKSRLYTMLNESTEIIGAAADGVDFAKSIAIAVLMQDTQLELIQDIIDTQPTDSTLYIGMTRLKNQLREGWVSYFADSFINDKIYEEIIDFIAEHGQNMIMGEWASFSKLVTSVVSLLNTVIFDYFYKVDYSDYVSSCILMTYADELNDSLANLALNFYEPFTPSDIERYQRMFNVYVAAKIASFEQLKSIATFNADYAEAYVESALANYCTGDIYNEFLEETRIWLNTNSIENINKAYKVDPYDLTIPAQTTCYFRQPSNTISENSYYFRDYSGRNITVGREADLVLTSNTNINKLILNGSLLSNGAIKLTCNSLTSSENSVINTVLDCKGLFVQNSGNLDIHKDVISRGDISLSGTVNQTDGFFKAYGDISGGSNSVALGDLYLEAKLGQTISRPVTVTSLTNNNPKGITINAAVTVNGTISSLNPITNGKNIVLTETANFADDSFTGDITVAGLSGEFPSQVLGTIYMTGGNITQSNDMECTSLQMTGGTINIDNSDTTITGVFDFGAGTVNLTSANLTVKSLQKAYASGGMINIDADSKYSNITDAVLSGTVKGDGTYYVQGDFTNNGTVNVGSMIITSKLPTTISGNNINTAHLSINSPKGVTINNKINVSQSYTSTGKVINPENIIFSGGNSIEEDIVYTVPLNIDGDLIVDGNTIIAKDDIIVKGNIVIQNGGQLITKNLTLTGGSVTLTDNSTLSVDGLARLTGTSSNRISVDATSEIDFRRLSIISTFGSITNNGTFRFGGDVSISSATFTGSGTMFLRGDLYSSSLTINRLGKLVLNGMLPQKLSCSSSPTFDNIIVSNPSRGGVTFNNTFYYYETYEKGINTVSGTVSHKEA